MKDNPFKLRPVSDEGEFIGYYKERQELIESLKQEGVTLLLSDIGFGKSSTIQTLSTKDLGIYIERCEREKIIGRLRSELNILEKIIGKDPLETKRAIFIDECAAISDEIVSMLNNLSDNGKKVVLSLTHNEFTQLNEKYPSIFDRVSRKIILNGFSKGEVEEYIKKKANGIFEASAVEEISDRFRKPRDVARICHNLWELKDQLNKQKITKEMIVKVMPELKIEEVVKGEKTTSIFEFIKNNPGCQRKIISEKLHMSGNSVTNLISMLVKKGVVTRTTDAKYFATTSTLSLQEEGEMQSEQNIGGNKAIETGKELSLKANEVKKRREIFQTVLIPQTGELDKGQPVNESEERITTLLRGEVNGLDVDLISKKLDDNIVNTANQLKGLMDKKKIVREAFGKKYIYKLNVVNKYD